MARLNSPYIENKLPAFTTESTTSTTATLAVPYIRNRLTSELELIGCKMSLILKNAATNKILVNINDGTFLADENNSTKGIALFSFDSSILTSGQYYKVQIAFNKTTEDNFLITATEVGYYSQAGIVRFIKRPEIKIEKGDESNILTTQYEYKGSCKLNEPTEKIYSYCFDLYDEFGNLIDTTGTQIHDSSKAEAELSISTDSWPIEKTLDANQIYELKYTITTINGYSDSCIEKVIAVPTKVIDWGNNAFTAELDSENALVKLSIMKKNAQEDLSAFNYNFVLLRADSDDDFNTWHRISGLNDLNFIDYLVDTDETAEADLARYEELIWADTTIEFGKSYRYALQAYNSYNIFSDLIDAVIPKRNSMGELLYDQNGLLLTEDSEQPLYVDFEDMFLTDGKRQLRIQFNPQISSFKTTVLETKVDTIGSKHPFIFRNGTVAYKEFPISGLISKLMDPNEYFKENNWNSIQSGRSHTPASALEYDSDQLALNARNIKEEKDFRNEVIEWLQNGEVKIFKSPTEGNFLVRLMNVTTTPNQTLGRMLSSFSCQAYEIADYNVPNLKKYNFIQINMVDGNYDSRFGETILNKDKKQLALPNAFFVRFVDIKPKTRVNIYALDGDKITDTWFQLPTSGAFELPLTKNMRVINIILDTSANEAGCKVIYGYYDLTNLTNFHFIERIEYKDIILQLGGGFEYDVSEPAQADDEKFSDIVVSGIRDISRINWIKIYKRPIYNIYEENGNWHLENQVPLTMNRILSTALYREISNGVETGVYRDYLNPVKLTGSNFQAYSEIRELDNTYSINNEVGKFNETNLNYINPETEEKGAAYLGSLFELDTNLLANTSIDQLKVGNGLILEMAYLQSESIFNFEDQGLEPELVNNWKSLKITYEARKKEYERETRINNQCTTWKTLAAKKESCDQAYQYYIRKTLEILEELTGEGEPE